MDRRVFLGTLVGGLLAARLAAETQQTGKIWRIGYLSPAEAYNPMDEAFERSMKDLGYVEGQNIRLERRYWRGQSEALQPLVVELVDLGVDVFVVWASAGAVAVRRATRTSQCPVVLLAADDPVQLGLVPDVARPGGNVTGISVEVSIEIYRKCLQLLTETVPGLRRVALLTSSEQPTPTARGTVRTAAKELNLELQDVVVATPA